jgi:cytochrome c biogenesis protein CcmG/thiol:disulfide interchange protein DsbE
MKIRIIPLSSVILFLIIFLFFYKGLQNSNIYVPKDTIKKDIPSFKVEIFETSEETTSELIFKDNKFYLVNIWSSWCLPCRDEHSFLMELKNQKNLKIVGLNYKDNYKKAETFLNELGSPYEIILSDKDGTIAIEWGAYGVPETFLIYEKKIIKRFIGPLNQNSFTRIKEIIR